MAVQLPSRFSCFKLTDQEEINGGVLTIDQKNLLSNDRMLIADLIMNLIFDPKNPDGFVQQDAHLKGQLAVYDLIFARSEEAERRLLEAVQQARQQNS